MSNSASSRQLSRDNLTGLAIVIVRASREITFAEGAEFSRLLKAFDTTGVPSKHTVAEPTNARMDDSGFRTLCTVNLWDFIYAKDHQAKLINAKEHQANLEFKLRAFEDACFATKGIDCKKQYVFEEWFPKHIVYKLRTAPVDVNTHLYILTTSPYQLKQEKVSKLLLSLQSKVSVGDERIKIRCQAPTPASKGSWFLDRFPLQIIGQQNLGFANRLQRQLEIQTMFPPTDDDRHFEVVLQPKNSQLAKGFS